MFSKTEFNKIEMAVEDHVVFAGRGGDGIDQRRPCPPKIYRGDSPGTPGRQPDQEPEGPGTQVNSGMHRLTRDIGHGGRPNVAQLSAEDHPVERTEVGQGTRDVGDPLSVPSVFGPADLVRHEQDSHASPS